jgi:hypothetical protein
MTIPYTIRFTVTRDFEETESSPYAGDFLLQDYTDRFRHFHDFSVDLTELRDEAGNLVGYRAIGLIEDRGDAEIPDSIGRSNNFAIALMILAKFQERASECLTELSWLDDITLEFEASDKGPVRIRLSS